MSFVDWLLGRNHLPPPKMEEPPAYEMSPRRRLSTVEVEGARKDFEDSVRFLRARRQSLDETLKQILLIQQESEAILEGGNHGGEPDEPDGREARKDSGITEEADRSDGLRPKRD
jgi:hypothetical protein